MVVDRAGLSNFPADGKQLVKRRLVNEIASIVLAVPEERGLQTRRVNWVIHKKLPNRVDLCECVVRNAFELANEVLHR